MLAPCLNTFLRADKTHAGRNLSEEPQCHIGSVLSSTSSLDSSHVSVRLADQLQLQPALSDSNGLLPHDEASSV